MLIRRERDEELINRLSNTGDVPTMLARYGKNFDWKVAVNHCVILSNGEDACMVFEPKENRHWECTTIFGETCRGKRAIEAGKAMLAHMVPKWADVVFGSVPNDMRHAQWFYRQTGGRPVGSVDSGDSIYTANDDETLFELRKAN